MNQEKKTRAAARDALGPAYTRRLLAAFSVLVDGEGLFKQYCPDSSYNDVCDAFRQVREDGNIDF